MSQRSKRAAALTLPIALVAGCSPSKPEPTKPDETHQLAPKVALPAAAPAVSARPVKVQDKSGALSFSYAYPAEAVGVPALDGWMKTDLGRSKAEAAKGAADDQAEMEKSGFPFRPHEAETHWTVTADGPRFLSLVGEDYVYTGGAHGMTGYRSLLWDRTAERIVPVELLFMSMPAFMTAMRPAFCKQLNDERAKKRGVPVKAGSQEGFAVCVDIAKQTLVPVSDKGKGIRAIRVVIGPYEAGPYAEGSYEVDLAVTPAMLKVVKPEFRNGFAG